MPNRVYDPNYQPWYDPFAWGPKGAFVESKGNSGMGVGSSTVKPEESAFNQIVTPTVDALGKEFDGRAGSRAMRGIAAGKPREALSLVPGSDYSGLTNPGDYTTGRDLAEKYGMSQPGDKYGGVKGALLDALVTPQSAMGGMRLAKSASEVPSVARFLGSESGALDASMFSRSRPDFSMKPPAQSPEYFPQHQQVQAGNILDAARTAHAANQAQGGLFKRFMGNEDGSLHLPFDSVADPSEARLARSDPEWINNRTIYHGTANPNITAQSIDPMKTDPAGLFGRGIYTTDSPTLAGEYADARIPQARRDMANTLFSPGNTRKLMAGEQFDPDLLQRIYQSNGYSKPPEGRDLKMSLPREMDRLSQMIASGRHEGNPLLNSVHDLYSRNFGDVPIPRETIYQGQSNYGNVLDLDRRLPLDQHRGLLDALMPVADQADKSYAQHLESIGRPPMTGGLLHRGQLLEAGNTTDMISAAREANAGWGSAGNYGDALIQALKGHGYDAMTHTGGMRAGGGRNLHQVVIGLDPNDKLGLGRATPYKAWGPYTPE